MDKFIFSTKYYDDDNQYVFSNRIRLPEESTITQFIRNDRATLRQIISDYIKTQTKDPKDPQGLDKLLQTLNIDKSKYVNADNTINIDGIVKKIESTQSLKEHIYKQPSPRYSYYTPLCEENKPENNVFAVRCWKEASVGWINALIEDDKLGQPLGQGDTLYLMLHDKDVPGYDGEAFEILTPEQISAIEGIKGRQNDNKTKWLSPKYFEVRIIIFNHVSNAIVDILKNKLKGNEAIPKKIKSIFENQERLRSIFASSNYPASKELYKGLDVDGFVDLCNEQFEDKYVSPPNILPRGLEYYTYEDKNGALLTELMHVKADIRSSKRFAELIRHLYERPSNQISIDELKKMKFPVIIKIYKSLFKDWENAIDELEDKKQKSKKQKDKKQKDKKQKDKKQKDKKEQIRNHRNKKALEDNLRSALSFFNNSSIFIRLVDFNDSKAYDQAVNEFTYFEQIGLYDQPSAWENLDYIIRNHGQNYLLSSSETHGNFVTPRLYGDETTAWQILNSNHFPKDKNPQKNVVDTPPPPADAESPSDIIDEGGLQLDFKHMDHFHDIALRILLIDDKVGNCKEGNIIDISALTGTDKIVMNTCDDCSECCKNKMKCKLHIIKRLMDDGQDGDGKNRVLEKIGKIDEGTQKLIRDYFYWNEKGITCYFSPTMFKDFIDDKTMALKCEEINVYSNSIPSQTEKTNKKANLRGKLSWIRKRKSKGNKVVSIPCNFTPNEQIVSATNVQIVGVRDVRTALLLLSKYKFDLIFCDYLLDYKAPNIRDQRDYAKQFFDFLSHEYDKTGNTPREKMLRKLRRDVLDNRGPLGKLWIMPITGYNQTFIQDLYRNKINLIDYRWNISNGADPITTPWQFLYHLNKLIELQLRMCVYRRDQLLEFLHITCMDLREAEKKKNSQQGSISFEEFSSIMGSDYATFMQLYGNKQRIKSDACTRGTSASVDDKSIFATYIWNKFYAKRDYYDVIEFNRLAHRFYHQASTMLNDREGISLLDEEFSALRRFIRTNQRILEFENDPSLKSVFSDNDNDNGLAYLRKVIDICTNDSE